MPKGCEVWAKLGSYKAGHGAGPDLRVLLGPGGAAREEWGLKGDRGSSRVLAARHRCPREGPGFPAGPEAQGHSERPNKDPASSQTGNSPFDLEMAAVWSQEVGQEAHRSLIGVLKEMRWKEAGSSAQAFGREGRGCLAWWTWGEVQAFPLIL